MSILIRLLAPTDLAMFRMVRTQAVTNDPDAFLVTPAESAQQTDNEIIKRLTASDNEFIVGAFDDGSLADEHLLMLIL